MINSAKVKIILLRRSWTLNMLITVPSMVLRPVFYVLRSILRHPAHRGHSNHPRCTAGSGNLLFGTLTESVSGDLKLLCQVSLAENLDFAAGAANQAGVRQLLDADAGTILKPLQLPDIDYLTPYGESAIAKTPFRQPAKQGHLPTLIKRERGRAGPAATAFVASTAGLAASTTPAPANPLTTPMSTCDGSYFMI
jgi:hypothetical protein